jgi:hypothetical protein
VPAQVTSLADADPIRRREVSQDGSAGRRLPSRRGPGKIEGYADQASVLPGEAVRLFVNTSARSYHVSAYRIGWYHGTGARLLYTSPALPGLVQPPLQVTCQTRTVVTSWHPSLHVSTAGWPPGDYLFRLTTASGAGRYIPLTLRSTSNSGRVVLLNAISTWQAYNKWGGFDLYQGPTGSAFTRSFAVSFDRPYDQGLGSGQFFAYERPAIVIAERLGLDLGYATSIDLERDPHLPDGARAVISPGHDEYYSPLMRTVMTQARDHGTNLAFLGSNAVFRRIRWAATPLGAYRWEICYKTGSLDPARHSPHTVVTTNWPAPPHADNESSLTGQAYGCSPAHTTMTITDPTGWLFHGTGVQNGTKLPNLIGIEFDRVNLRVPTPRPLHLIAHSPVTCHDQHTYADVSYYTTPSGAGVLDTGTTNWEQAAAGAIGTGHERLLDEHVINAATINVLLTFAAGPAARTHPAVDNLH